MPTTISTKQVSTTTSGHKGVGPPAMSMIPPMTPATPTGVPAPFPYMCTSGTGASTSSKLLIADGETLTDDSCMDVDAPGNQPSQPAPLHDIVTQQVNAKVNL